MDAQSVPTIWMAYVSHPIAPAALFEQTLRRCSQVVSIGPSITDALIKQWHLQEMNLPIRAHQFPLPFDPDSQRVSAGALEGFPSPDLYLWVESVPGYAPPQWEGLRCPKACYLLDCHLDLETHVAWARTFDFVFLSQRAYVAEFKRHGCRNVHWLPLGCVPALPHATVSTKLFDAGFVGTIVQNTRRAQLLKRIAEKKFYLKAERCFGGNMFSIYSQSRLGLNIIGQSDLNLRFFEVLSTGTFLLTEARDQSGLAEMFVDGEDLGLFSEQDVIERIRYFLIREEEREQIARRGQAMVHQGHTLDLRAKELLNVCLRSQARTPTAAEWRERSLAGSTPAPRPGSMSVERPEGRSFIIPVLNASTEGRQEFDALLSDLHKAGGEVIAVFNSKEAALAFQDDPRITLSASLNVNVGVPRAWNLGVHLATQPTLFFLNADLRIQKEAIQELEKALWTLPAAAVVGPEGSFFGFYTYEDIVWFDKGCAQAPQKVDAVSGFLFATKRDLFLRKILQFEDEFTPCFTEEWDLGLQATQAGYHSYVVPVTGYDHAWGVSKSPHNVIRFGKHGQVTVIEQVARNRIRFWRKWLLQSGELELPPKEPNPSDQAPPSGPALLQSKVVELMKNQKG